MGLLQAQHPTTHRLRHTPHGGTRACIARTRSGTRGSGHGGAHIHPPQGTGRRPIGPDQCKPCKPHRIPNCDSPGVGCHCQRRGQGFQAHCSKETDPPSLCGGYACRRVYGSAGIPGYGCRRGSIGGVGQDPSETAQAGSAEPLQDQHPHHPAARS